MSSAFSFLQPVLDVFKWILLRFHDLGIGWGLAIIAMTIVVRALLIPLTLKQFRSMQAMQRLQPQIKELNKKYKGDKQRLNQEIMAFYKENKVNPLGSCLPLAAQLPVFFALYFMLRRDLKTAICPGITSYAHQIGKSINSIACDQVPHAKGSGQFLFIPDLTHKASGAALIVLIILYVGSQLASSLLAPMTDKTQRNIMLFLPLIFVTFIIQFPAGLMVYWITTNLWTAGQQYLVRRSVGPMPAPAPADANGKGIMAMLRGDKEVDGAGARAAPAKERSGKLAAVGGGGSGAAPPPPPRKKKKRSGRRR